VEIIKVLLEPLYCDAFHVASRTGVHSFNNVDLWKK